MRLTSPPAITTWLIEAWEVQPTPLDRHAFENRRRNSTVARRYIFETRVLRTDSLQQAVMKVVRAA
jgi:hypothetical protein